MFPRLHDHNITYAATDRCSLSIIRENRRDADDYHSPSGHEAIRFKKSQPNKLIIKQKMMKTSEHIGN